MNSQPCPNCHMINRPGAKFCRNCGHDLQPQALYPAQPASRRTFCSQCGSPNDPGAGRCVRCGAQLNRSRQGLLDKLRSLARHPVWRRRLLWGGLVASLVLVAACLVLAISLLWQDGESDAEDTPVAVEVATQLPTLTLPAVSEPDETDNPRIIQGLGIELPRLTDEDEVEIGREAAAEFERDNPLSTDESLLDRVTRIGNSIVPHQPRTNLPYTFKVVDSPEINALAFPGGLIYIYRGMIEFVQTDDELAGVIGHEIAHVALRHSARQIEAIAAGQMAIEAVLSENADLENVYQDQSFQIASEVVTDVVMKGWGRVNELDADEYGTVYMAHAGYDPQAVLDLLNRFASQGGEASGDVMATLLSTHPPFQDRIARVEQAIVNHGLG